MNGRCGTVGSATTIYKVVRWSSWYVPGRLAWLGYASGRGAGPVHCLDPVTKLCVCIYIDTHTHDATKLNLGVD
jgi:hypothetical protein